MPAASTTRVRVWDLPTRIFHWLLVALICNAWVTFEFSGVIADNTLFWHRLNGYAILILVLWRILWGFVGSPASRFGNFFSWPWTAARYGLDLMRGRERHYLGHNPLGSYMIVALLLIVLTQGLLGLYSTEHNGVAWGPLSLLISDELSAKLTHFHVWMFKSVLLVFVAAHIAANVLYRLVKKDQLIEAMIIGSKPDDAFEDRAVALDAAAPTRWQVLGRALLCLLIAVALFAGTILGLGAKLIYW